MEPICFISLHFKHKLVHYQTIFVAVKLITIKLSKYLDLYYVYLQFSVFNNRIDQSYVWVDVVKIGKAWLQ